MSKCYRWRLWCKQVIVWRRLLQQVKSRPMRIAAWRADANPKYGPRAGLTLRARYERGLKYKLHMIPLFSQRERELYLSQTYPLL